MARGKSDKTPNLSSGLMGRLRSLQKQMNSIYKDTYSTDPQHKDALEKIGSDIESHISGILNRNNTSNIANISQLYAVANLKDAVNNKEYTDSILSYFEDKSFTDQIVSSYTQNKWIVELDREIDTVIKYMPKLQEALDAIKDSVLTADNFDKEWLSFTSPNIPNEDFSAFAEEMEHIKKQYGLYDKAERWYEHTSKYGETFVYKAPYKKALSTLMNRRNATGNTSNISGLSGVREYAILESGKVPKNMYNYPDIELPSMSIDCRDMLSKMGSIKLQICKNSFLESAITEAKHSIDMQVVAENTSFMHEAKSDIDMTVFNIPKRNKKTGGDAQDGLVTNKDYITPSQLTTPGLILKDLKRENVILLYMEDICLGYYYLEFLDSDLNAFSDSIFSKKQFKSFGYTNSARDDDKVTQTNATDELLKYLSSAIVHNLDDKFINNNPRLRDEIYAVLKHNDIYNARGVNTIRVTYLSPTDVEHITFRQDPETHRGISDLAAGLIADKMWCCLWIANTIGILTRGQDKRVYYVKQTVEQNIAQTLLNVINQIKKQNFNIMQIENMNSILGITGKYNDYIIPVGPSGDPPVQMEVMQGQSIDPQTELMDKLEEIGVNSTGITVDLVNARLSLDFSTQLTMSSTKFMRFVFKRQSKYETHLSSIATDCYNAEVEPEAHVTINSILPAPIMLNVNNLNQIMDLINNQSELLAGLAYPDNSGEDIDIRRSIFKQEYIYSKMGSYLKINELEGIKTRADLKYTIEKQRVNDETE